MTMHLFNRPLRATVASIMMGGAAIASQPALAASRGAETVAGGEARITGTLDVEFGSRLASGATGVDVYTYKGLTIGDLMVLNGTVHRTPEEKMSYSIKFDVFNPASPGQVAREVAIQRGDAIIDENGAYKPAEGKLRLDVVKGAQTSSGYSGVLKGREVTRWWEISEQLTTAQQQATKLYARYVDGKTIVIQVSNPDPLGFQNLVLAAGPFSYLPETTVSGNLDYDYELGNWLTDNDGIKLTYTLDGQPVTDKITGSIHFVEEEGTATVGSTMVSYTGYYDYSLRFNETAVVPDQAFFDGNNEQSELDAFFSSGDTSKPGIYGRVYFKDAEDNCKMVKGQDGTEACVGPTRSVITYDLKATGLSYAQLAAWFKIETLVVGPFTDE
ncbi:MAG: hypothetical protein HXY22_00955 [Alphaproteobacteria bacterium]|nr:hypothetical protein [Alphaproteobacteria bacterium]